MFWKKTLLPVFVLLLVISLGSCGGEQEKGEAESTSMEPPSLLEDSTSRPARTLPIPGSPPAEGSQEQVPPEHPPVSSLPPLPPGSATGAAALTWSAPEGWVAETPSSPMRRAQYRVPGPDGEGQCVVFYFGPGQGGDPQANARRWAGQFKQPDGRSSLEVMKASALAGTETPVLLVEVTGTYDGGMTMSMAPAEEKPGYMLLGAIAQGPDANWFFKFTGPEATVRAQRDAFEQMLRSLGSSNQQI